MTQRKEVAVATKRSILFLLLPPAAMILVLAGCGGSTANVQNPAAPPDSKISIAFQPAPPGAILINATTALTAVVSNDPSNAGVDWSLTCSNPGNCGSLTALHTGSGQATTYTPPLTFSGNSQAINIVAFATADNTQNILAPITVTAFASNLKGNYVLQAQGIDTSFGPYQFAGVIVLNGNGAITSGEQTVNFFDQNPNVNAEVTRADPITSGSYFLGPDGRGTITVNTNDQDVGLNGVETFSFVYLSTSQALIAETDFTESATGTMDLQTSIAAPSGGYAFVVSGTDIASQSPTAFGGIFNIDSPKNISGNGSLADQNLGGTVTPEATLSGTLSTPDSFGAVTMNLTAGFAAAPIQFTAYIVDATHMKLIESDNTSGTGSGSTGGVAIGQGTATGTFGNLTAFSGTYVFGMVGVDLTGFTPSTLTSAGLFTADGAGNLVNGFTDTFLQQSGAQGTAGAQISGAFTGAYALDNEGIGRVRLLFDHLAPAPNPVVLPRLFFYLTGNGNPPLVLDGSDVSFDYPSLGAGIAYPQSAAPLSFGGKYGLSFTQQNGSENDGTAQINANSSAGTLSGVADTNSTFNPTFDNPISGTFAPSASNGRFAGTLTGQTFDYSPFAVEYYIIDPSHGFFVETDLVNSSSPSGVVSFGYYAARTPVCSGCP
jgi:hypothetical protein